MNLAIAFEIILEMYKYIAHIFHRNTTAVDYVRAGTMVCALTTEFLVLYGVPAQRLLDEVNFVVFQTAFTNIKCD